LEVEKSLPMVPPPLLAEAYEQMHSGEARFRVVLTPDG
jgi:hypothetical protein